MRKKLAQFLGKKLSYFKGKDKLIRLLYSPDRNLHSGEKFITDYFGKKYEGITSNFIDWGVYFKGGLEKSLVNYIKTEIKHFQYFFDIGSNTGSISLPFVHEKNLQIISFEPLEYNYKKLREKNGELIENKSLNKADGPGKDKAGAKKMEKKCAELNDLDKTGGLPNILYLKIDCKYMITNNENVQDGLVNGASGILKAIIYVNKPSDDKLLVKRLWLFFDDKDIGANSRLEAEKEGFYKKDNIDKQNGWTTIKSQTQTINTTMSGGPSGKAAGYHIERTQFPLIPCEALTIHKSQGQTYDYVAVDITYNLSRPLLYVALSRVTTLNGLFLFGKESILSDECKKADDKQKKKKIKEQRSNKSSPFFEMQRLRKEAKLKSIFPFLDENYITNNTFQNHLSIIFHNVRSFNAHKSKIIRDSAYMNTDLLMFVSAANNILNNTDKSIPGYSIRLATGTAQLNTQNGQLCYMKENKFPFLSCVHHNANWNCVVENKTDILEFSMYKYVSSSNTKLYICMLYKHPNMTLQNFKEEFNNCIKKSFNMNDSMIKEEIIILGDFNIDFNKEEKLLRRVDERFGILPVLDYTNTNDSRPLVNTSI